MLCTDTFLFLGFLQEKKNIGIRNLSQPEHLSEIMQNLLQVQLSSTQDIWRAKITAITLAQTLWCAVEVHSERGNRKWNIYSSVVAPFLNA